MSICYGKLYYIEILHNINYYTYVIGHTDIILGMVYKD